MLIGALSRNRTSDTRIFSPLLYRLSYQGMVGLARLELATSRLSGVRSNHLSYRPLYGRGGGTRTPGPMVPNHVRYQTALHLEVLIKNLFGGPSGTRTPDLPVMSRAL